MLRLDTYQKPENLVTGHFQYIQINVRNVYLAGWSMMF